MMYAIISQDGYVRKVIQRLNPREKLDPSERLLPYLEPEHDPNYQAVQVVEPVEDQVLFTIQDIPDSLEKAKLDKSERINRARIAANTSTFTYAGKYFAVDPLSRSDIDGTQGYILANNSFPPSWPGAWKAVDNTYAIIPDIATWNLFYAAMVNQGLSNFLHAQGLKTQLTLATTINQVLAVPDW